MINADAMQTYDAFPILTAQPTARERADVPHRLYGVLPLSETLSAARWRTLAAAEIERCIAEGRTPILCGGSGLYLRTLMQGIAAIPDAPPGLRDEANADWQAMGAEAFRARLAEQRSGDRGAAEARRSPAPCPRLGSLAGDRPAAQRLAERRGQRPARWRFATVLLAPERGWLRARIESRFDAMLTAGVLAEVRAVFDRAPDPRWPGLKAHGAPELFGHFRGELSLDEARRIAIDHTRQYAKRQMTWFRHQMTPDLVLDPQISPALELAEKLLTNSGV